MALFDSLASKMYEQLDLFIKNPQSTVETFEKTNELWKLDSWLLLELISALYDRSYPFNFQKLAEISTQLLKVKRDHQYWFVDSIDKIRNDNPPDAVNAEGVPFWNATKICPEKLDFSRPVVLDDGKQFTAACAVLLAKLLAVAIPPDDKIAQIVTSMLEVFLVKKTTGVSPPPPPKLINTKTLSKETGKDMPKEPPKLSPISQSKGNTNDPCDFEPLSRDTLANVRTILSEYSHQGVPKLPPRLLTLVEQGGRGKENRAEVINFLYSASSLRCTCFGIKPLIKYKLEKWIFDTPAMSDSLASMAASSQ